MSYGTWGISPTVRRALALSILERRLPVEDDFAGTRRSHPVATSHGAVGQPAPVHPHLFGRARVSRMQTEYLFLSGDEAQRLMRGVPE